MLKKRLVAILVGLALIVMGAVKPTPARADAIQAFGYAMAAAGFWVLLVVVGTWVVYGPPWSSLDQQPKPDMDDLESHPAIRFGPRCPSSPDSLQPLACW